MFLKTLCNVANRLDKLGYYDIADQIDEILISYSSDPETAKEWTVDIPKSVLKGISKLPKRIQETAHNLITDLKKSPYLYKWPNFSKLLSSGLFHCHLTGGRSAYAAIWEVDASNRHIRLKYVGTRGKARYNT